MESEKVSFLRYRGSKLNKVKELDAFPKIPEPYVKTSPVGGTRKLRNKHKHVFLFLVT